MGRMMGRSLGVYTQLSGFDSPALHRHYYTRRVKVVL